MPAERIRGRPAVQRASGAGVAHHPPRRRSPNAGRRSRPLPTLVVPAASTFVTLVVRPERSEITDGGIRKRHHLRTPGYEATAAFITLKCGQPPRRALPISVERVPAAGGSQTTATLAVSTVAGAAASPAPDSGIDVNTPVAEDKDMAPVRDTSQVASSIKEVIQHLFDLQSQVHGYVPETREVLVDNIISLTHSLSHLQTLANSSQTAELHDAYVAPELIDYVDDGRNPDIYTRDLVESVQRGNAVLNGKMEAFRGFGDILATQLKKEMPETSADVDQIMRAASTAGGTSDKQEHSMGNGNGNG